MEDFSILFRVDFGITGKQTAFLRRRATPNEFMLCKAIPNGLVIILLPPVFELVAAAVHWTTAFNFSSPFSEQQKRKALPYGRAFLFWRPRTDSNRRPPA